MNDMICNGLNKNTHRSLSVKDRDVVIDKGEGVRDGGLGHITDKREHFLVDGLEIEFTCVKGLKIKVYLLCRRMVYEAVVDVALCGDVMKQFGRSNIPR
jgi:hypothetical protein